MEQVQFHHILVLLGAAVVLLALFRRVHLPHILAYLGAGMLVGPYGLAWIPDVAQTRVLAEFGLVFLLFTIGLEFSLRQLLAMKNTVLGLGGSQVLISCAVFGSLAWLFGESVGGAVVIGGVLALSSTAIAMKLLIEQFEQNSRHGRQAFGVLLFQDLIVVPFLILIPALAGDGETTIAHALAWAVAKGVVVLALILVLGRWLLRPLFHEIAAARSREFFMLTVLLVTLTAAWVTQTAGLSAALGAFLAGLMIGETEFRHQVEADILPFRDVLLGLFFITIGMLLNLPLVLTLWPWVLAAVLVLILFKTVLVLGLATVGGSEPGVALRTGLVLAQGGEFGFVLLAQAGQFDLIAPRTAQLLLAAVILSMALAPVTIRYNGRIAKRLVRSYHQRREANLDFIRTEARATHGHDHVIVCGYGRSGQNLGAMLETEGIPFLALDLDPVRVRDARDAGEPVVYGDAVRRDVLEAAGLNRARALAVSFDDRSAALKILEVTRALRPDMPILVRTRDDVDLERLQEAGATEVVPESLEGSMMMATHLLLLLGVPMSRVVRQVRAIRRDRYRMLRGFFHGGAAEDAESADAFRERLHSVTLPKGAYAVGKILADLHLAEVGVTVTAVRRGGIRGPQPADNTPLYAGDVLVLYGAPAALERGETALLEG